MRTVIDILQNVLKGTSISGYYYNHGGFEIEFDKNSKIYSLELNEFYLESKEHWEVLIKKCGIGTEPEDTIRALILTELLWEKGSEVLTVQYSNEENCIYIIFKNQKRLIVNLSIDENFDEFALSLKEQNRVILDIKNNKQFIYA